MEEKELAPKAQGRSREEKKKKKKRRRASGGGAAGKGDAAGAGAAVNNAAVGLCCDWSCLVCCGCAQKANYVSTGKILNYPAVQICTITRRRHPHRQGGV